MLLDSPVRTYEPGANPFSWQGGDAREWNDSAWYGEESSTRHAMEGDEAANAKSFFTARDLRPSRSFRPMCIMFWGRRGAGKTLAMTILAEVMRQAYLQQGIRYHKKYRKWGRRIAANYHMKCADFYDPRLVDQLVDFPAWARDMLVCIDEILAFFPNRRSLARPNLNFSTFLQQIRKLKMELFFTTQFPQHMDGQILEQIDLFAMPIRINHGRDLLIKFWDWWGQYTGKMWKKSWPPIDEPHDYELTLYNVHHFYGYYPTEEVVAPMWSDKRDEMMERSWSKEFAKVQEQKEVQEQLAQMQRMSELEARGYAENLDQFLNGLSRTVALGRIIAKARDLDPDNIRTQADLAEYMRAKGWKVTKSGNLMTAERDS